MRFTRRSLFAAFAGLLGMAAVPPAIASPQATSISSVWGIPEGAEIDGVVVYTSYTVGHDGCRGGSCGLRPARAAARGVKSLAGRVREAKPVRRLVGRVLGR